MGHLDQCTACDRGEHNLCDGTVVVNDQDGPSSRYVCKCYHRRAVIDAQRVRNAEARVRKLMREVGIDRTHTLALSEELRVLRDQHICQLPVGCPVCVFLSRIKAEPQP